MKSSLQSFMKRIGRESKSTANAPKARSASGQGRKTRVHPESPLARVPGEGSVLDKTGPSVATTSPEDSGSESGAEKMDAGSRAALEITDLINSKVIEEIDRQNENVKILDRITKFSIALQNLEAEMVEMPDLIQKYAD